MTQERLDIFEKVLFLYGEYVLLNLYSFAVFITIEQPKLIRNIRV